MAHFVGEWEFANDPVKSEKNLYISQALIEANSRVNYTQFKSLGAGFYDSKNFENKYITY